MSSQTQAPSANGISALLQLADHLDSYRRTYDGAEDSRAVFTYAYVLITTHLADALPLTKFFDPEWIVQLALNFASHYTAALEGSNSNLPVPAAWEKVFGVIRNGRTSVLEDLIFSITAHIVHDLPIALSQVGMVDSHQGLRIHDFHLMNDVLAGNIQLIADSVTGRYEPFWKWLDHLEEKNAQIFTNYGFRISRGMAWYNAMRLLDPASRADADAAINKSVAIIVDDIRRPSFWSARIICRCARFVAALFRRRPRPDSPTPRRIAEAGRGRGHGETPAPSKSLNQARAIGLCSKHRTWPSRAICWPDGQAYPVASLRCLLLVIRTPIVTSRIVEIKETTASEQPGVYSVDVPASADYLAASASSRAAALVTLSTPKTTSGTVDPGSSPQ